MIDWFQRTYARTLSVVLALMVISVTGVTGLLLYRAVKAHLMDTLQNTLETQARLVLPWFTPEIVRKSSTAELQKTARAMGEACACRVTAIDQNGVVYADSEVADDELYLMDNHALRPEVKEALAGRPAHNSRYSTTRRDTLSYVAIPNLSAGRHSGVLRLAVPLTKVEQHLGVVRTVVFQWTAGITLASVAIAFLLAVPLSRRIRDMSAVAGALVQGRFETRLRRIGKDELGRLGEAINFLAEKIQQTVEALSHDKTQLLTVLSNMVEGVVAVDAQGKIAVVNASLCHLFGIEEPGAVGKPLVEVLRHNQLDNLVHAVLSDGQRRVEEIQTFSPVEKVFEAHAVPLNQENQLQGVLVVLHDITRLRQLEQVRRDFVANVSHELRTPLASIKGFAETLRMGAVDDREHRGDFLKSIEDHSEQMARLIDDLLDLAAIESGKRAVQREQLSLHEVAQDVVKNLQPLANRRHITLAVTASAEDSLVPGDRLQIRQVLTNLVDNAIKFNRDYGRVDIVLAKENEAFRVSVNDTGVGIPMADLPRVFERFFRVEKARSREMGGTGLGLAIVKHIVEAHGGKVSVHSVEGQGSSFSFALPLS